MKFHALGQRAEFTVEIAPNPANTTRVILEGDDAKLAHKALGGWGNAPAPYRNGRAQAMENGEEITVHYKAHIYSESQFDAFAAQVGGDPWGELFLEVQMCKAPLAQRSCDLDDNEY